MVLEVYVLTKEANIPRTFKAQAAPMQAMRRRPGMPFPGKPKPGAGPYPNQPSKPAAPYTPAPETQPGYCPGMPSMELARAYVPWQVYGRTYTPAEALEKGTLFPELYRPYFC